MLAQPLTQLPHDARRVVVRGTSGSGKTTLSRAIALSIGAPHVELDSIYHQSGWTALDPDAFRARVSERTDGTTWVACGNYKDVAQSLTQRADTMVLYDLPRRTVMVRVIRRTLWRALRREELWNGNKERWRSIVSTDPDKSVILWAWRTHARRAAEMRDIAANPPPGVRVILLSSLDEERLFRAGLRVAVPT